MIMRFVLTGIVVLVAAGVGFLTFDWYHQRSRAQPYGVPFELVSSDGRPVTQMAFRGHPSAVFFGYTHCQDVCPATLHELDAWLAGLGDDGTGIAAWFVTVDPERDTPQVLKAYLESFSGRIRGISGNPDRVHDMLRGFAIYYHREKHDHAAGQDEYDMAHTTNILLLDSRGRLVDTINFQESADSARAKLRRLESG